MHSLNNLRARGIRVGLLLAVSAVLASCVASTGLGGSSRPAEQAQTPSTLSGRLALTVIDQNGKSVSGANVDVRGAMGNYRSSIVTDGGGVAEFKNVPWQVEITVNAASGGYGTQTAAVEQGGTTQVRMVIQTFEDPSQQNQPGGGFGGAAPAGGGQR